MEWRQEVETRAYWAAYQGTEMLPQDYKATSTAWQDTAIWSLRKTGSALTTLRIVFMYNYPPENSTGFVGAEPLAP